MQDILDFIEANGHRFDVPIELLDLKFHDTVCEVTNDKMWFRGICNDEDKYYFSFGSWNSGAKFQYRSKKFSLTKEERLERKQKLEQRYAVVANMTKSKMLEAFIGESDYMRRKGFDFKVGCIKNSHGENAILVPMQDVVGRVWNAQIIQPSGFKSNFKGKTKGLFCPIGEDLGEKIYLCEGFSTAYSVHCSTGGRVLCCFGLENIPHVLHEIRKSQCYSGRELVVVVDNDHEKPKNSGHLMRDKLLKRFFGLKVISPTNVGAGESDYNDVFLRLGGQAVKEDIEKQLESTVKAPPPPEGSVNLPFTKSEPPKEVATHPAQIWEARYHIQDYINGVEPMPPKFNENGKQIEPKESEVADHLAKYYRGRLISCEGSRFRYEDNVWKLCGDAEDNQIKVQIMVAMNGMGGDRKYVNVRNLLYAIIPCAPRNMFIPNPYTINFNNGTLHLSFSGGKWLMDFRKHNPFDYCTTKIPIDYDETRAKGNELFEDMVARLLGGNPEKIRSMKQMYGACLAPIYPHFFMLVGPPASGKSTLLIGATRLVSQEYVGGVQPHMMVHPYLESLINKLVNVVTDIDVSKPIEDAVIKQVEDRVPMLVNRKYKAAIRAPLPAVHLFGGNDIPPTQDRGSKAHTRRWTIIHVDAQNLEAGGTRNYIEEAFDSAPVGVLNFALDGLEDLLNSGGKYFQFEASREHVEKWQVENDPISSFVDDAKKGQVHGVTWDENASCKRADVWRVFKDWYTESYSRNCPIPKRKFYSAMEKHGGKSFLFEGYDKMRCFHILSTTEIEAAARQKKSDNGGFQNPLPVD